MENINSDLLKLTSFLENKDLNSSDSEESVHNKDYENLVPENQPSTSKWDPTESIVDDEDTVYVLKSCKNPLLKNALISNIKKRKILNELAKTLELNIIKMRNMQQETLINAMKQQNLIKCAMKKRLGAPYFKQKNWVHSPRNEDYIQICNQKQLLLADTSFSRYLWTLPNKNTLLIHIFYDIFHKKLEEVRKQIKVLKELKCKKNPKYLASLMNDEEIFSDKEICAFLIKHWNKILVTQNEIKVKNVILNPDDPKYRIIKTISDWNTEYIDWSTAVQQLKFRYSKQSCRQMWCCYLHPKYSKSPWKEIDNMTLMKIAKRFKMRNWDAISNCLKIQKSPYQCCVHFFSNVYDKFTREKWTEEENTLLLELVESSRIGNFVSWSNIAYHFKGRPVQNLYTHYYRTLNPLYTKGAFTIEEDVILLAALKIFNDDMKIAHSHLPFRTLQQIRERYKTMSSNDSRDFTIEDDCKIISHVNIHGDKNWNNLCKEIDRSTTCVRHRSITLKKWFMQNPDTTLDCVPRRSKGHFRKRVKTRLQVIALAVRKILALVEFEAYDTSTVLNVPFVHKKILNSMNEYQEMLHPKKKKKIIIPKKKNDDDKTLYQYFINIFAVSARSIHPFELDENQPQKIANKASRIQSILKLLGAKLNLPSIEEIETNDYLDRNDRLILKQMVDKPSISELRPFSQFLPPTVESLTGIRSLMLHCPVLRQHSKGEYKGYNFYVYLDNRFEAHGRHHSLRKRFEFMRRLAAHEKKIVLHEQTSFFQRLKMIYFWASIFHNTLIEPMEIPISTTITLETPQAQAAPVVERKRGRPKLVINKKIMMMNLAKMAKKKNKDLKKAQVALLQELDNPLENNAIVESTENELEELLEPSPNKKEENVKAITKFNLAVEREITLKNIDTPFPKIFLNKKLSKRKARGNRGRKKKTIKKENKVLPETSLPENAKIEKTKTEIIPIQSTSNQETHGTELVHKSSRKRKSNPASNKNIFTEDDMQFESDIITLEPSLNTTTKRKIGRPSKTIKQRSESGTTVVKKIKRKIATPVSDSEKNIPTKRKRTSQ